MRKVLIVFFILLMNKIQCQTNEQGDSYNNGLETTPVVGLQNPSSIRDYVYGSWGQKSNTNNTIKGSIYLFNKWETKGVIYAKDKKKYKIPNLNINIRDHRVEAKFDNNAKDSLFIFKKSTIEKVFINNKEFIIKALTFNYKTDDFFVQKIKNTGKTNIYKLHYVFFKEGEFDRLSQQKTGKDRYIKAQKYFIEKNKGDIKLIKLKKSEILDFFHKEKKKLKNYIKKNNLKVKKEKDFIKLIQYYNTL